MRANRVVAGLVPLVLAGAVQAEPLRAPSRIDEITVHPDGAEIRRLSEDVQLVAGENRVELPALPAALVPGSLRASGHGDADVQVVDVEIREDPSRAAVPVDPAEEQAVRRAQEEVDRLEARKRGVEARGQFLGALQGWKPDRLDDLKPEVLAALMRFLSEGFAAQESERLEVERSLSEAKHRVEFAQRARESRTRARPPAPYVATLELLAARAARVDLVIEYAVTGASWYPQYEVAVSGAFDTLDVASDAVIRQTTGEDWSDVTIALSTAGLELGVPATRLSPWRLTLPEPPSQGGSQGAKIGGISTTERAVTLDDQLFVRGGRSTAVATVIDGVPVGRAEATMIATSFDTRFHLTDRRDVASDGVARRFPIGTARLAARVRHECAPALSPKVALVAVAANTQEAPFLRGDARMRIDGQFSGHGTMPEVAPGQELTLVVGVDRAVQVERKLVHQEEARDGDRARTRRAYRLEVHNGRRSVVHLLLRDQVPLATDREVEIHLRNVAPKVSPDDDGIVEWALDLPGGGTQSVELAYEVGYPSNRKPPGL